MRKLVSSKRGSLVSADSLSRSTYVGLGGERRSGSNVLCVSLKLVDGSSMNRRGAWLTPGKKEN